MRKLTQKEIDQAPEWAIDYFIDGDAIRYGDAFKFVWWDKRLGFLDVREAGRVFTLTNPIPRKEFDITKFDFGDSDIWKVQITKHGNDVIFFTEYGSKHSTVNKEKTIALAKHFKLTAEDLL